MKKEEYDRYREPTLKERKLLKEISNAAVFRSYKHIKKCMMAETDEYTNGKRYI